MGMFLPIDYCLIHTYAQIMLFSKKNEKITTTQSQFLASFIEESFANSDKELCNYLFFLSVSILAEIDPQNFANSICRG
jgi:hypothetical protein